MEADSQPQGAEPSHRDEVRQSMRDAVLGLLAEKPFKDLKIDEIASAAGLTRTGFYFYFKNKGEVLVVVVEELAADLFEEADRWWSRGDEDQQTAMREALEGTAMVYERHAPVLRAALEVTSYDAEFADLYRQLVERFVTSAAQHIRDEQAAGRARAVDPGLDRRGTGLDDRALLLPADLPGRPRRRRGRRGAAADLVERDLPGLRGDAARKHCGAGSRTPTSWTKTRRPAIRRPRTGPG